MEAEVISCEEFARRVGTSSRTIRRKIESGKIHGDALQLMENRKIPYLVYEIALKQYQSNADYACQAGRKAANDAKRAVGAMPPKKNKPQPKPQKEVKPKKESKPAPPPSGKKTEPKEQLPNVQAKPPAKPAPIQPKDDTYDRLARAKMQSEEHKARLQKLKIDEQEGRLVDSETMKQTIVKLVGETREALLNIPDNLGPELLACKDLLDLQTKLNDGINSALLNLSRFSTNDD